MARETLEFDHSVRLLEATDKRTHPLRLELNNFFFVQAIAGPYRNRIMSGFLRGMSWLTLVVLPVVLLLYIQVVFLPYHNVLINYTSASKAFEEVFGKTPIPTRDGGSIPIVALLQKRARPRHGTDGLPDSTATPYTHPTSTTALKTLHSV